MMIDGLLFKGGVVGAGIVTFAAGAIGEIPTPSSWERLGIIGILGMGIIVAAKIIFMQYNDNKAQQARNEALLREAVEVMRETRDVLKDFGGRK